MDIQRQLWQRPAMQFICPICAGVNWREVVIPKGTGYYKTDFCECCECSAMFRKPELFTVGRGKKAEGRKPIDDPSPIPRR